MKNYESWEIARRTLEYFNDTHEYLVDGVLVPSITTIIRHQFPNKYRNVSAAVLHRAAEAGTAVHNAIENWCKTGEERDLIELRNFKFLKKQYKFKVLENETPVILFKDDKPISAGRLDLVLRMDGKIGGADIKRTSVLDKEYLAYQLNLYRIAYRQCYGIEWEFLRGVHLRQEKRRFVEIPINENMAWFLINEYLGDMSNEH